MKKHIVTILILLSPLIIIFIFFAAMALNSYLIASADSENPLRLPVEYLREGVLELTPLGTSMGDVIEIIESEGIDRGWHNIRISRQFGVNVSAMWMWRNRVGPDEHDRQLREGGSIIIGGQSINVIMGRYDAFIQGLLFTTHVNIWWAFDENSELIDVFVDKQIK